MLMAGPGRASRPRRREPYRARGLTFGAKGAPTTRTCSTPSATSPPPSSGCRMFHRPLPRPSRSRAPRPRRSPQHAAGGPRHPTGLFDHHRRAAGAAETGSTSSQVLTTAKMLATDSNRLKDVVGKFPSTVHAAGAGATYEIRRRCAAGEPQLLLRQQEGHGDREQEACRDDRRHGSGDDLGLLSDGG